MAIIHKGLQMHRLKENPLEKVFAKLWVDQNKNSKNLEYLLAGEPNNPKDEMSQRDAVVAATVVQWLGSPVGQSFLRDALESKEAKQWRSIFKVE